MPVRRITCPLAVHWYSAALLTCSISLLSTTTTSTTSDRRQPTKFAISSMFLYCCRWHRKFTPLCYGGTRALRRRPPIRRLSPGLKLRMTFSSLVHLTNKRFTRKLSAPRPEHQRHVVEVDDVDSCNYIVLLHTVRQIHSARGSEAHSSPQTPSTSSATCSLLLAAFAVRSLKLMPKFASMSSDRLPVFNQHTVTTEP